MTSLGPGGVFVIKAEIPFFPCPDRLVLRLGPGDTNVANDLLVIGSGVVSCDSPIGG